ncbi:uncharacterized protein V1477_014777 [Vespula maculifrons]|uniref:DUF4817 domain-containing protein n=1 Tax=Vespula maculifrons TaxID=7453 RepID=A0ABD2BIE4_VESMC
MMKRLTLNERTKIVQFYFENNRSIISTQRAYRRHFNVKNAPAEMTIRNIIARFQQQGTVSDLPRSGRPRSVFTNANIQRVEESVLEEPGTSTRRRSSQLELSRTSLRRISRHLLLLFPYKIQLVQDLHLDDYKSRLNFSIRFQQLVKEEDDFLNRLIMSDQADFHLDGIINKENCVFWGAVNPTAIRDYQLHPIKCTVWCGLTSDCVIGPFFFENDDGNNAAIVTELLARPVHYIARERASCFLYLTLYMMLERTNERTNEWMDRWMDRWMDGWMDGWMDRSTKNRMKRCIGEGLCARVPALWGLWGHVHTKRPP